MALAVGAAARIRRCGVKGGKECGELDSAARKGKSDWARCDRPGFFVGRWGRWGSEALGGRRPRATCLSSLAGNVLVDENWKWWGKFMATKSVLEQQGALRLSDEREGTI
jgi:hypothetical protein